ncbi:acetylornithine deacetylase/succinyl-diaminopimelate desuccinylase-like protein [Algoriphagus ratkowskyi]|uniref:Acetylornithine deacetylase/succinyl-diaminopimelate desuccinylase-like protein n=1 Tax=Algoriphagus ratkowskyi TaxID=57028 RepID=A0A2W7R5I2_9BACT|nr:M20/M25/M40 family metallo-hydrolase [Algoriphagus ratkowskyi]PZX51117.1 acetylornithine deacetylase/succinyl-diaminopimelate desuccinylase-like protein [Algoriphagus ratkowskyi]TXD75904.1 M20/M25/M40 family metallo-hydrolase [Algoriphagus ratkowskyi]
MRKALLVLSAIFLTLPTFSQTPSKEALEALTEKSWQHGLHLLQEIVKMPNDAAYPEQISVNIEWCEQEFEKRGWQSELLETDGIPLLLVSKSQPKAEKTALFYFHMDGQAVDRSKWNQPDPYIPVLKSQNDSGEWEIIPTENLTSGYDADWRIFGRSTSDDKGPIAMFLTGWDALQEAGISPNYNIKIILDFEEEQGSPSLPAAVLKYKNKLTADMMLIMDGPRHTSNEPTLSYGARGISEMTLTTYGPKLPQHSGHYGNYAPNPAFLLAQLLASMKDVNGIVTIPGFYDGIKLTESEKKILAQVPDDENAIRAKLGIGRTDQVGLSYQESIQYPSLNIRGMESAWVGKEARTIVPATAVAEIDVRLVPESDPERLFTLIQKHIEDQGFHILDSDPSDEERMKYPKIVRMNYSISYQAFRTPMDSEAGAWLRSAMNRAFGKDPVQIRISGGSIPISPFVDALGIPAVTIPTVNADNNQHSPNENIRLGNYKEGITTVMAILTEKL